MSHSLSFKPVSVTSGNDRLLIALFIALIVHALLLLINFSIPEPKPINKDIEITLVKTKTKRPPKRAKVLAQEHQQGGGNKVVKPTLPKLKMPSEGQSEKKNLIKKPEPVKAQTSEKIITQKVTEKKIPTTTVVDRVAPTPKPHPEISPEALRMQIAQLGAKIASSTHEEDFSNIKSVNQVSAHKYAAAQYTSEVVRKIERIGNLNIPKDLRQNWRLLMDIGIKADGSVYSVRIRKPSGNPAFDEAAKKVVRMSSPFSPLPKALLSELNVLVISRSWSFHDESL